MQLYVKATLLLSLFVLGSPTAWAAGPYYVAGDFNGWNAAGNLMTEGPTGTWSTTITTTPGPHEFKVTIGVWTQNWPGSNARVDFGDGGSLTINFYPTPAADGWSPTANRVGWNDPGLHGWEIMGSFNGWGTPVATLNSLGNGQYSAEYTVATPGTYQFKFRRTGDWGFSIGADFGNSAGDVSIGTTAENQIVRFELDLPNGRYRVTPLGADIVFDGLLKSGTGEEWDQPTASAVQDNYTGYGDQKTGLVYSPGSELDGLHVKAQGDRLYLGISGNLETNGNTILVFLDTKTGGQNTLSGVSTLGGHGALEGMEGDTFDSGFYPDYVLSINNGAGQCYVDWYELADGSGGTFTYRGHVALNSGNGTLADGTNPNSLQLAFDNTNVSGVTGDSVTDVALATTGIEAGIPLADLGLSSLPAGIGVQVALVNSSGFVSSQSLPTMPAATADPGEGPVDFNTITDLQYATVTLAEATGTVTLNGQAIPSDFSDANYSTLQAHPTTWGDQQLVPGVLPGSEIDKILAREDKTGKNLLLGITGNLHWDGTNLVIFLDTKSGGETTLADHGDRLAGNAGDTLPCPVDYAVLLNRSNGNIYVDLYDLQLNVMTAMGSIPDDALMGGPLTGGAPEGAQWALGANMTNLLGVNDNSASDPQTANAATATTGFELSIPLAQVGQPTIGARLHIIAMLTGAGGDRDISNQILPAGLGGGIAPFGAGPTDLTSVNGQSYQCMEVALGTCHLPRFDAEGDGDVDMDDFGAFQLCWTGNAGGSPETPAYDATKCACFDHGGTPAPTADGNIDTDDFASFQACVSGPAVLANIHCAGQ